MAVPSLLAVITLFNKLKSCLPRITQIAKVKIGGVKKPILTIIYLYFALVALLVLTYYAAWIYQWHMDKIVMEDLLDLIKEMIGTSMIAFITFIAGCLVDTDHDGVPDQFEKEDEKE